MREQNISFNNIYNRLKPQVTQKKTLKIRILISHFVYFQLPWLVWRTFCLCRIAWVPQLPQLPLLR